MPRLITLLLMACCLPAWLSAQESSRATPDPSAKSKSGERLLLEARERFDFVQGIDGSTSGYTPADKASLWKMYLDDYEASGHEVAKARERLKYWQDWRPAPTPAPPPRSTPTTGQDFSLDLGGGVLMPLVWIEPGTFTMGSPLGEEGRYVDESPQTRVTISKGFWMGETEVTQAQWRAVMGTDPSLFKGDTLPVEQISWNDAVEFCRKASSTTGCTVTLPTEAQWEYACRAGTTTRFSFGDSDSVLGNHAWYTSNSDGQTRPVRQKRPNAWGLYDMHGNVWEWCADWYGGGYPGGSLTDPMGSKSDLARGLRGGCWYGYAGNCRSAERDGSLPAIRSFDVGFRPILLDQ